MGIIGTGNIARQMADTVVQMDTVELYAVASRTREKAAAFAEKYGIPKAFGQYGALAADPDVELVYIATPHAMHHADMLLCLQAQKPTLCEKPFTLNAKQAREAIACARANDVFLCEAMWVRFQPLAKMIPQLIQQGVIGTPYTVLANKGEVHNIGPTDVDPALGGSSLLGNGVYAITAASLAFGPKVAQHSGSAVLRNGIDGATSFTLQYEDGKCAYLTSSLMTNFHNAWYVCGDKGIMEIQGVSRIKTIRIYDNARKQVGLYEAPPMISGYEYEVQACCDALAKGQKECPEMPLAETLRIMELLDGLRFDMGLSFD